jgi:chromosome segregation ATPase
MTMPEEPSQPFSTDAEMNEIDSAEDEFEEELAKVERSLVTLKERYAQLQQSIKRQAELQQRAQEVQRELRQSHLPELQAESRRIQKQLAEIEVALESCLLSKKDLLVLYWRGITQGLLSQVFWQAVRFGGLGIVIGWILKSFAS